MVIVTVAVSVLSCAVSSKGARESVAVALPEGMTTEDGIV